MAHISLYYTEGSSDKEYHLQLLRSGSGWHVAFQYGRRGNANNGSYKIQDAPEDKARRTFEKYIREKVSEGYTVNANGRPHTTSVEDAIARAYEGDQLAALHAGDRPSTQTRTQTSRAPRPEESSLHTGQRDRNLPPAPKAEPKMTEVGLRRFTWAGRTAAPTQTPQTQPVATQPAGPALHSQQPLPIDTDEEVERMLDDDNWGMQDKYDGKKVCVRIVDRQGQAFNKKGEPIVIAKAVMDAIISGGKDVELDGELIGQRYVTYDILKFGRHDLRQKSYDERYKILVHDDLDYDPLNFGEAVEKAPLYVGREAKRRRYAEVMMQNGEGVVFKRLGARFTAGKTHGDMRKKKFYATCSCIVGQGREGKRSVAVFLRHNADHPERVQVGNVTIGGSIPIPPVGSIIEVKYLYAYPGGSLYQPSYIGPRDDVDAEECLVSQLKYKQGTETDNGQ